MNISTADISALLSAYLWPFFRIAALVGAAPLLGTQTVPVRVRISLALALTAVIVPVIPAAPAADLFGATGVVITVQQVLIGLAMGFALQLVFAAFVFAGQLIGTTMGLGFASLNDPVTGVVVPTVSQFYTVMVTLLFFALNGHLILIEVLADSFHSMPVGAEGVSAGGLWELVRWASHLFSGAVLIALPAMAALLVVNIGLGVVTRAVPQLNIFAVGFPVTLMLGLLVMWITLPTVLPQLNSLLEDVFVFLRHLVQSEN
ncbi:MAG: flagellar biosynthetic protein FliR [Gammaproteobacteria bacterium]